MLLMFIIEEVARTAKNRGQAIQKSAASQDREME
jgi:hypothetical protein